MMKRDPMTPEPHPCLETCPEEGTPCEEPIGRAHAFRHNHSYPTLKGVRVTHSWGEKP